MGAIKGQLGGYYSLRLKGSARLSDLPGRHSDTNPSAPDAIRELQAGDQQRARRNGQWALEADRIIAGDSSARALYLLPDQSRDLTGIVLSVDGGHTTR